MTASSARRLTCSMRRRACAFRAALGWLVLAATAAACGGAGPAGPAAAGPAPAARIGASLAYDAASRAVVLFGGQTAAGSVNDTWTGTDGRWSRSRTGTAPSPRAFAAAAPDGRGRVLVFGGESGMAPAAADTWRWD